MNLKKVYGIVGYPVTHSLSPVIHNAALKAAGIDAEYRVFDIAPESPEDLANFFYEAELNSIGGCSVTMPYKQTVMAYMDSYDPLAKAIGSVNTVKIEPDPKTGAPVLTGYNTDATGFIKALNEKIHPAGKRALVLGAGGAARAVVYSLRQYEAEVFIFNRTPDPATALAKEFEAETIDYRRITKDAVFDIIINTTPIGGEPAPNESLLFAHQISPKSVVMDLVTRPQKTQLLKEAEKAEASTISGERMLLHQAAGQFEIWFAKPAPIDAMEKALAAALKKR